MIPQILDDSYKTLEDLNGKFFGKYFFIFQKPKALQTENNVSLIGDFFISTRNHLHKFQGHYFLYGQDIASINFQKKSNDKKCEILIIPEPTDKIIIDDMNNVIKCSFKNFISILNNGFITLK